MLTLKKICAFVVIASYATIFSSSNEEVMLDTNADRNSITLKKSGSNEISTTENKIIGRDCPYLIIGRTEKEDQVIVTTAACSLLAFNLVNAFYSLTPVEFAGGFFWWIFNSRFGKRSSTYDSR